MTTYRVTFDRVGRNHSVDPITATVDGVNHLAEVIYQHARPHLMSRDVEVVVDLDQGTGMVLAGFRNGGTFTVAEVTS
jgi:hypothetical protein